MRKIRLTTQFRKDFKKIMHDETRVAAYRKVAAYLMSETPLPPEYLAHPLKGNYKGCMECHIGPDYLLIWTDGLVVTMVRIGSHSQLFS